MNGLSHSDGGAQTYAIVAPPVFTEVGYYGLEAESLQGLDRIEERLPVMKELSQV